MYQIIVHRKYDALHTNKRHITSEKKKTGLPIAI